MLGKKYLISFKTSDDTIDPNSWALRIYCKKDNTTVLSTTNSRGSDVAFTVPEETVGANVQFIIVSGTVLNNVVIKPMIRLASITDDTYQPYAMTNRELTEFAIKSVEIKGTTNDWGVLNIQELLSFPTTRIINVATTSADYITTMATSSEVRVISVSAPSSPAAVANTEVTLKIIYV